MKTFTLIHVAISLAGILSGFVVLYGMLTAQRLPGWTKVFLITTVLTSLTGFFFPIHGVTPALITGVVSLIALAIAIYARYVRQLTGGWRKGYVISAVFAFYLNVVVLVVQSFQKIPALKEISPTQNDPPFKITQLVVLLAFFTLGVIAAIKFRDRPVASNEGTP